MNTRLILPLLLSLQLSSCSSLIGLFDDEPEYELIKSKAAQHYCVEKKSINFAHQSEDKVRLFENIHQKLNKKYKLNFIETSVLWSLFHLAHSPHNTSPSARFQIIMGDGKTNTIYDFNKTDPRLKLENTYLQGLHQILKVKKNKRSLNFLLDIAQNSFPSNLEVNSELAEFISSFQDQLLQNPTTKRNFFKANNPLQPGETFKRVNFNQFKDLKFSKTKKIPEAPRFLLETGPEINNGSEIECNMDLNLYNSSIYLLNRNTLSNNVFSVYSKSGTYFIGITSFTPDWEKSRKGINIQSKKINKPEAICIINKEELKSTIVASLNGRDPGQHIFHLLQYGLTSSQSDQDYFEFIRYPRHQFLLNPPRLVYESSRGSKKQLQSILKMNFPVYNAQSLAEVWIMNQNPMPSLITDNRNPTYQSCHLK